MFFWDDIGETRIRFDAPGRARGGLEGCVRSVDWISTGLAGLLDACTVPIAIHDHTRAGILGTGTLLQCGERHLLLTAAHLLDGAAPCGNWLIPERATGQMLCLEGAQVQVIAGVDIALLDLARTATRSRLLRGRQPVPARLALRARPAMRRSRPYAATYCLAGYPAEWSRFERGYLAAKRLTITTRLTTRQQRQHTGGQRTGEPGPAQQRFIYGRTAERNDGQVIHTPAMEGMSGAAIWEIAPGHGADTLHLAGVQSAFLHSGYLRGDAAHACVRLLRQ